MKLTALKKYANLFDQSQSSPGANHSLLEADLRLAVEMRQFFLHYQPIVDETEKIIGVEALVRWSHPIYGTVSPSVFIPLAEKTGLILRIGQWVFEKACEQVAIWEKDSRTRQWIVSVNVSAHQLQDDDFVGSFIREVQRFNVRPERFRLELTESALVQDLSGSNQKIKSLREFGFQFALDDFGTGYSSFSYLRHLSFNFIKIDKSFVDSIPGDGKSVSIIIAILAMAENLNMKVVVEGVETKQQFEFLKGLNFLFFQGYLFGRPVSVEVLETSLRSSERTDPVAGLNSQSINIKLDTVFGSAAQDLRMGMQWNEAINQDEFGVSLTRRGSLA